MPDLDQGGAPASTTRMLTRGLTRHCPRCGAGHLYHGWFTLADRCPRCDHTFAREEGFFLGAFVINFGATTVGLAAIMAVLIAVLAANGSHEAIVAVAIAAGAETVVVPLVFYPFSKTLWSAIDMAMHRGEAWATLGPPSSGGHPQ